jgi:hypothetical protein
MVSWMRTGALYIIASPFAPVVVVIVLSELSGLPFADVYVYLQPPWHP